MLEKEFGIFRVLRRWNSFTPRIPSSEKIIGGGYFLQWNGKGIVIDPGFNYLENMKKKRINPGDVNAIIVTHSHPDHTADLEPILMMKAKRAERLKSYNLGGEAPIDLFMSMDAAEKYRRLIVDHQTDEVVNHVTPPDLSMSDIRNLPDYHLKLQSIPALHYKPSASGSMTPLRYALSIILHLYSSPSLMESERCLSIGITSDTRFNAKLVQELKKCEIVIAHLGSIDIGRLLSIAQFDGKKGKFQSLDDYLRHAVLKPEEEKAFQNILRMNAKNHARSAGTELVNILSGNGPTGGDPDSGHLLFKGLFDTFQAIFSDPNSKTEIGIVSEFGQELGSFRHKVTEAINHVLFDKINESIPKRIFTGDVDLGIKFAITNQTCTHLKDARCNKSADGHNENERYLFQCTLCNHWYCLACIKEHSIKHYNQGIFYNCDLDWRPSHYPAQPLFTF